MSKRLPAALFVEVLSLASANGWIFSVFLVSAIWADSELPLMEWYERHARLGTALQNAINDNNLCLPKVGREMASGDVAVWSNEPGFPRVIICQAGKKIGLMRPGDEMAQKPENIDKQFVSLVDPQILSFH